MPRAQLPSGLIVEFREWEFDDMERWAKKAEGGGSTDDVLSAATVDTLERVVEPGPYPFAEGHTTKLDASRLLKTDVTWWLYRARAASHPPDEKRGLTGEHYVFDWRCGQDKKHVVAPKALKLCDLKMKPLPEASVEHVRTGKPFGVRMPGGELVKFVLPTIGIDKPLRQLLDRKTKEIRRTKKGAPAVEATQAQVVACQIESVSSLGDNASLERKAEWVGKLKFREWKVLEDAIVNVAPSIQRTAACVCDECGATTEVRIPLTPGFFLPSREEAWEENTELDELEKMAGEEKSPDSTQVP